MKSINKEKYNQIIDEIYENYLTNFKSPECPMGLDVQPDYYQPMTKERFIKSVKEKGPRGDEFSKKWGLKIDERDLSLEERREIFEETPAGRFKDISWHNMSNEETIEYLENIPTKIIILTYNNETIEIYE